VAAATETAKRIMMARGFEEVPDPIENEEPELRFNEWAGKRKPEWNGVWNVQEKQFNYYAWADRERGFIPG
jgi:hypothetical protein